MSFSDAVMPAFQPPLPDEPCPPAHSKARRSHKLRYLAGSMLSAGALTAMPAPAQTGPATASGTASSATSSPVKPEETSASQTSTEPQAGSDIIVTGTRSVNLTARRSQSPITVVSSAALQQTGVPDLASAITRIYPGINLQSQPGNADALTSSVQMRGLNPNHVLVLVDGIRRHSSSNIFTVGGVTFGATPVDLNMIPASAIDHIEVLEDGASALYGSDAIAGVINIITKKDSSGITTDATIGANLNNRDGLAAQINANAGLNLGDDGYLNLAGQVSHRAISVIKVIDHRLIPDQAPPGAQISTAYTGTVPVPLYVNRVSNIPEETREALSASFGKALAPDVKLQGLLTFAHRHSESPQQFRLPTVIPSVYPNGFSPINVNHEYDFAGTIGVAVKDMLGFDWNVASTYGKDIIRLRAKENINLGILRPTCVPSSVTPGTVFSSDAGCGQAITAFQLKGFSLAQWDNKLDLRRDVTLPGDIPLNVAFGAEHRLETYVLTAGDPVSYQVGGGQAIAGLTPRNAGSWNRTIMAGYVDFDATLMPQWTVGLAGRYEHYTDSGSTTNAKVSTRYEFSPAFAVRGTLSNGFRAPTLAEQHYSSATLTPTSAGGLLPSTSDAARQLGAIPLRPERSTNYSIGAVLEPIDRLQMEIDAYQIDISGRIVRSNSISGTPAINALAAFGFNVPTGVAASNVTVNYLVNGATTRTRGLDVKANYTIPLDKLGRLALSAAANFNKTDIRKLETGTNGRPLLNSQAISLFTTEYPASKIILNANWSNAPYGVNLRATRFGSTKGQLTYQDWATGTCPDGTPQRFSTTCFYPFRSAPKWLIDVEVNYDISDRLKLSIGANNILSARPTQIPQETRFNGTYLYDQFSAGIPITGSYYFTRLVARF